MAAWGDFSRFGPLVGHGLGCGMAGCRTSYATPEQALTEALFLGLMAPGESEAQACAMIAEEFAAGLGEQTVEIARAAALERCELEAPKRRSAPCTAGG